MASLIFELSSKHKYELRRMVEDEIILLKGRIEMNKSTYNLQPLLYDVFRLEELINLLNDINNSTDILKEKGEVIEEFLPSPHYP